MSWYNYRQNNSGGSFVYDEYSGISVNVWIEADNAVHADDRAINIGLYFDGDEDCSCCGDRWSSKSSYWNDDAEDEDPPEPNEPIYKDEFNSWDIIHKWRPDGEYETFVHPLGQEFYGAHATTEVVRKLTYGGSNGYGIRIGSDYVTDKPVPVSEFGWDKSGNFSAPSAGYQYYSVDPVHKYYLHKSGMRIQHVPDFGYTTVWTPNKQLAEKVIAAINAYLDVTPRPDPVKAFLDMYPGVSFTPEVIPIFTEEDDI